MEKHKIFRHVKLFIDTNPFKINYFILLLISVSHFTILGQNEGFIKTLSTNPENKIIVLRVVCDGCVFTKTPCIEYLDGMNRWEQYVLWGNSKGLYFKKFNICGGSKVVRLNKMKYNAIHLVETNQKTIDSCQLKYPLTFIREDSTWREIEINHFRYFDFSFPSYEISNFEIKSYAFEDTTETSNLQTISNMEIRVNNERYTHNNNSIKKQLLDQFLIIIEKKSKKLKIIAANT